MRQNRPASITVIAILHFIFGGLGIAGGLCTGVQLAAGNQMFAGLGGGGAQAAQQKKMQEDMQKRMDEKVPSNKLVSYTGVGLDLVMSTLMIAGGIGLLKLQPWARTLSILYALLSISWKLFTAVYAFAFMIPAFKEFIANFPREQGEAGKVQDTVFKIMDVAITVSGIMPVVFMIYPVIVLIIMLQPSVREAVQGRGRRPAESDHEAELEDYRDEPEDYRDEPEGR